jgi:DNA repair protein RecO (recombination protein O)
MRTRYLSLEAIVMRTRPQGEADAWVTLLAPVAGLIAGVAKNGLRSQKRFMGALVPVTRQEVLLARRQGVWYLEEAQVVSAFARVKADAMAYAVSCYAIEEILGTHPQGTQAADTFPLLLELFEHLESGTADMPLTRLAWDLRLLDGLGLAPHLADCVVCGRDVPGRELSFHGPSGGLLCIDHAAEQAAVVRLSRDAVALTETLLGSAFPALDDPRSPPRVRRESRAMMDAHMAWHMPVEVRSRLVLEQLSRVSTRRTRP